MNSRSGEEEAGRSLGLQTSDEHQVTVTILSQLLWSHRQQFLPWQSFNVLHVSETKVDSLWGMTLGAVLCPPHAYTYVHMHPPTQVTSTHINTATHKDNKHDIRSIFIHISNAYTKHWGLGGGRLLIFPVSKKRKGQAPKQPKLMPKPNTMQKWSIL